MRTTDTDALVGKLEKYNDSHSTITTTKMTSGVIAGYKAYTKSTPINIATLSDSNTIQDLINRISALERIQPSQLYKVENCPNCGGTMKLYADDHILKCQYCKSVVFVGIKNING